MTRHPAASVVLPVYNGERYLESALQSVLGQTFGDYELLVMNDGSTDSSLDIVHALARADSRVTVIDRPNQGLVSTLNEGIQIARGDIVMRMDQDDLCAVDRFERQMFYLRDHPACVALGSKVQLIDPEGLPICEMGHRLTHEEIDAFHLTGHGSTLFHPTLAVRREALLRVGGYRKAYEWAEDYDLFLRLAEIGRLAVLPEVLLQYRQHLGSVGYSKRRLQFQRVASALADACARRGLPAPAADEGVQKADSPADGHRRWAWWALRAGHLTTARKHALKAWRCAPLSLDSYRVMACALRGH